jgi:hypothetical protein
MSNKNEHYRLARLARFGQSSSAATDNIRNPNETENQDDESIRKKERHDDKRAPGVKKEQSVMANDDKNGNQADSKKNQVTSQEALKPTPPCTAKIETILENHSCNKKKRRTLVPPRTVLSQALSHVLSRDVTVLAHGDFNEEKMNKPSMIVLQLPFPVISNEEDDWTRSADYVVSTFVTNQEVWKASGLLQRKATLIQEAATCHSRIQVILRKGWMHQKHVELDRCLRTLSSQLIIPKVAQTLQNDMQNVKDEVDEGDIDDLFADEYNASVFSKAPAITSRPVDALVHLLESPASAPTADFLQDLFEESKEFNLATLLVQYMLKRIKSASSSGDLQQRLAGFSNLLSLAPVSTGQTMAIHISSQLEELSDRPLTGNKLEREVWLAPLFEAAAYSILAAGSELAGDSAAKSVFARQVQELPGFPVCIFERNNTSYSKVQEDCRRTMANARSVAVSALRIIFRKADKALVFSWLRQIANSKYVWC